MKIYLVRHGRTLESYIDPTRPLSSEGIQEIERLGQRLLEKKIEPVLIYHSGLLRAQQTAAILATCLKSAISPQVMSGLLPEDDPNELVQQIVGWTEDTLLVTHLPYIEILFKALCPDGPWVRFETGTTVCLENRVFQWAL